MATKSVNNIAIVAIAYALMIGADYIQSTPFYYASIMLASVLIMFLCSVSKGLLIKIYGLSYFIPVALYFPLIFFGYDASRALLWSGWLNFANIIIAIELMIICHGVYDGLLAVFDRWIDNVNSQWLYRF